MRNNKQYIDRAEIAARFPRLVRACCGNAYLTHSEVIQGILTYANVKRGYYPAACLRFGAGEAVDNCGGAQKLIQHAIINRKYIR